MKETALYNRFILAASNCGAVLFRNNRGMFRLINRDGFVRAGLEAKGSSDLIGWMPDGRFLAVEVKLPNKKPSKDQLSFLAAVNAAGGVGFVSSSEEQLIELLSNAMREK
jgi:hypothetical protein